MRTKTSPLFDYLDEAHEANWSPESIVNQPQEMYQPVCLCLVSRLPLFDTLQVNLNSFNRGIKHSKARAHLALMQR